MSRKLPLALLLVVSLLAPGFGQLVWILLAFNHQISERLMPHLPKRFQERGQS